MCHTPQPPSSPYPSPPSLFFPNSQSDFFQRKSGYPTDPKFLSSGVRFSRGKGERRDSLQITPHGESPIGWMSLSKAWLSSGRHSRSEDKHLPLAHPKIVPFQIFPMTWHTESQVEGISRVAQEHPERRS